MSKQQKVVIIGAGPGGLSAAMILANRGFDVTVVEKADRVGGRTAEMKLGDYSFDLGPTFLHQKFALDEIFAETGRESADYIEFVPGVRFLSRLQAMKTRWQDALPRSFLVTR